jgi:hypothetical protein
VKLNGPKGLNRRELTGCLSAFGLTVPTAIAMAARPSMAAAPSSGSAPNESERTVRFSEGTTVPALGQGSARLGQGRHPQALEEDALGEGISLGMTLIDTAEMYGNGSAERLIGRVIAGRREHVFLVSKVWPTHVGGDGIERACEGSLARLGTDHLDLYLLHWPTGITDLSGVVAAFEKLRSKGKIRTWGVSNFSVSDMERLLNIPHGDSAQPTKFPTASQTAPWNKTCCHGVRGTQYQSWPTLHLEDRAARCLVIRRSRVLARHTPVRRPPSPWRGRYGAVRSLQSQNPATSCT